MTGCSGELGAARLPSLARAAVLVRQELAPRDAEAVWFTPGWARRAPALCGTVRPTNPRQDRRGHEQVRRHRTEDLLVQGRQQELQDALHGAAT
jgi:hypothetical protein